MAMKNMSSYSLERSFALYMGWQIKEGFRMSQSQIESLAEPRAILKRRQAAKKA